jgi:hypothetical protein
MVRPIGLSVPHRLVTSTPEEEEAFNDVERRSKVKQQILQEILIDQPKEAAKLRFEIAMLTEALRVLADRVKELENQVKIDKAI